MPASASSFTPSSTAASPSTGEVPTRNCVDAGFGVVRGAHLELVPLAEPSPDRLAQLGLPSSVHVEERRRSRPAVHVLVGAPDREIDVRGIELDRERPDGVRQIPQHERAGAMRQHR